MARATEDKLAAYLNGAVDSAAAAIRETGAGGRNEAVNRECYAVGTLLAHGLPRADVEGVLVAAALAAGLPAAEARATVARSLSQGERNPRSLPDSVRTGGVHRARRRVPLRVKAPPVAVSVPPVEEGELVPPAEVRPVLVDMWDAMKGAELSPAAVRWAEGRGLCVRTMHHAGWRSPAVEALREVWRRHGVGGMTAAGLARANGNPAWRYGQSKVERVWFPIWSPVWDAAPVAYRWRAVETCDGEPKTLGMTTSGHPWRHWPLGVRWSSTVWGGERWEGDDRPVVIVEGEPDWIAVARVVEPGAVVLGSPTSGAWPDHWWRLLEHAGALWLALDADGAGAKCAASIGAMVARHIPDRAERPPRAMVTPSGANDWNDALKAHGWHAGMVPILNRVQGAE